MTLPCPSSRQQGFTLVELLVVFAIGALLVGLMPIAYVRLQESVRYRNTVSGLMSELKAARQQARFAGVEVGFSLDVPNRRYGQTGKDSIKISDPLQVSATVSSEDLTEERVATIWFMPDGGSTGGSFDVLRPTGGGTRVRVDWLTGRVEQERIVP